MRSREDSGNSFVSFALKQFSISMFKVNDIIQIKPVKHELNKRKTSSCLAPFLSLRFNFHNASSVLRIKN